VNIGSSEGEGISLAVAFNLITWIGVFLGLSASIVERYCWNFCMVSAKFVLLTPFSDQDADTVSGKSKFSTYLWFWQRWSFGNDK
jgi:hypothetical protein